MVTSDQPSKEAAATPDPQTLCACCGHARRVHGLGTCKCSECALVAITHCGGFEEPHVRLSFYGTMPTKPFEDPIAMMARNIDAADVRTEDAERALSKAAARVVELETANKTLRSEIARLGAKFAPALKVVDAARAFACDDETTKMLRGNKPTDAEIALYDAISAFNEATE